MQAIKDDTGPPFCAKSAGFPPGLQNLTRRIIYISIIEPLKFAHLTVNPLPLSRVIPHSRPPIHEASHPCPSRWPARARSLLSLVLLSLFLAGCSDMQFVNATNLIPEKDPREDIVLTNVSADLTSGGQVQQQITGSHAIYSEAGEDLVIKDIAVTSYDEKGIVRSITRAELGEVYFADLPERGVGRRDMKFAGDVLYRTPQADDPTTDSMWLTSQLITWDESQQKFRSPEGYEMILQPKGQAPVRQTGKSFEAAQDLTRFVVRTGLVTTELEGDASALRRELEQKFQQWQAEVDRSRGQGFVKPTPIVLPPRN